MAEADVLIIGAGAAGLAAAQTLCRSGLKVAILEARNRIGGRIYTVHDPLSAIPIELGAEFIHGQPKEIWQIVQAANLPVCEIADEHWYVSDGELKKGHEFDEKLESIFSKIGQFAGEDRSLDQFLAESCGGEEWRESRRVIRSFVEGFHAARTDRVSLKSIAQAEREEESDGFDKQFRLVNGYESLVHGLMAGIQGEQATIRLNTIVREIKWQAGRVEVKAETVTGYSLPSFVAPRAVITLPLPILRAAPADESQVRIIPEFTDKLRAMNGLAMGSVIRVTLRFRERFWENDSLMIRSPDQSLTDMSFLHSYGQPIPSWWTTLPLHTPTLVGWAAGPAGEALSFKSEQQVIEQAVTSLSASLKLDRGMIEERLESWRYHDWQADPFSRGAYSYILVGGLEAQKTLAAPVAGTLFFAGEATHYEGESGTVHGAIATGHRAAAEVLATM